MKRLILCLLTLALPLMATDSTATIRTPNELNGRLAGIMEKWIQLQNAGTVKYPGATPAIRRQVLLDSILKVGVQNVFKAACAIESIANDCIDLKAAKNAKTTAEANIKAAIENIIQ